MSTLEPVSFRIEAENRERLRKLAEETRRDQSEIAREALNHYLDVQEWQLKGIHKAIASIDKGQTADDEAIKAAFTRFKV